MLKFSRMAKEKREREMEGKEKRRESKERKDSGYSEAVNRERRRNCVKRNKSANLLPGRKRVLLSPGCLFLNLITPTK